MYELQDEPTQYHYMGRDELSTPVATLISNTSGQTYHIAEDDNCYVLVSVDDSGRGKWVNHWFPEAVEVLKTLPPLDSNKGWLIDCKAFRQIILTDPDMAGMLDNICFLVQTMETDKE